MNTFGSTIAELRVLIGYLGEKGQSNWWNSEFFSPNATSFLAHIFNRGLFLAQYQGVTAAASRVHDEAIGIGSIYHLFRLPISLEQIATDTLSQEAFVRSLQSRITSTEAALSRLSELSEKNEIASLGPVSLGSMSEDLTPILMRAAGVYKAALNSGVPVFPYMRALD